jgi:hypothetical protein
VKWAVIAGPKKNKGGLGVQDLRKINISLLCKWWWKIETGEGLWQEIVRKKIQNQRWDKQIKMQSLEFPCVE